MTNPSTTETTAVPTRHRRTAGRALAAAAVVVGLGIAVGGPVGAGLGEPVDPRDPADDTSTTSTTEDTPTTSTGPDDSSTTTDETAPATTEAPATSQPADADTPDEDADDDGTSIAALGAVGLIAFLVGLLVAAVPLGAALSRRKAAPVPAGPLPATPPPPAGGIAIGPAPSRDTDQVRQQRLALAEGLIALRDQMPSEALGAQAAGALAAAGIVEIAPLGQPFDPAHHRAVDQVVTDDPTAHNTVVSIERVGYADGAHLIRQPDVVVARHGAQQP